MTSKLQEVYSNLVKIKDNLVKLAYERRKPQLLQEKLEEASLLYVDYIKVTKELHEQVESKELKGKSLTEVEEFCNNIKLVYKQIEEFCSKSYTRSNNGENSETSKNSKMGDFDLKVALSLIPVMTDDEIVIQQLIDSIEYYETTLKNESKQSLINFVLKNRLTQIAKLKLCTSYATVQNLIIDMRKNLLPKKSATAIQNKMQTIRQGETSIDDFGHQLSKMFVDLTIAQSDGNSNAYTILKTINEKQAVKRFADGLRNRRISTIIAARDYDSLKDAVQGAKDEETSLVTTSSDVFTFNNRKHNFGRGYFRGRGSFRGSSYASQGHRLPPPPPPPPPPSQHQWRAYSYASRATGRGGYRIPNQGRGSRASRGRFTSRVNNGYRRERIYMNEEEEKVTPNQFFREKQ